MAVREGDTISDSLTTENQQLTKRIGLRCVTGICRKLDRILRLPSSEKGFETGCKNWSQTDLFFWLNGVSSVSTSRTYPACWTVWQESFCHLKIETERVPSLGADRRSKYCDDRGVDTLRNTVRAVAILTRPFWKKLGSYLFA